jgi:hypothetical protein
MSTGSEGSSAKIGYGLGGFLRTHPIKSLAILIGVAVLWHMPKLNQSGGQQATPVATTANISSSSPVESCPDATTNVHEQESQGSAEIAQKQVQAITTEQRQVIAHQLAENFREKDLEIGVIAAGTSNDTLLLSSDLFKDSASRTTVMRELRAQWQDLLCKEGFKTVSLSDSGVFSSQHDFALQCPKSAQDRSNLAAGLENDFQSFGKGTTVFVTGANNEVLSSVLTSDDYKIAGNRAFLFELMKKRGTVRLFCSAGFKEFRVYYLSKENKPSRFPLNCSSTN